MLSLASLHQIQPLLAAEICRQAFLMLPACLYLEHHSGIAHCRGPPAGRDTLSPNARRSATPLLTVLPTVAELPPVVCFYSLAHCVLPATLDGCLAAAAEAVLPAPSPSQWVVLFGPRPPSPPHPVHIMSHFWLNTELGQPGWDSDTLTPRKMVMFPQDLLERARNLIIRQ